MADGKMFHAAVITPEGSLGEAEVSQVVFPAHDGLMGVLTHRAPLLTKLGIGEMTLETEAGEQRYFVSGGYAQMKNNVLTILPNEALLSKDVTPALLEKEKTKLAEASGVLTTDMSKRQTLAARVQAMEVMVGAKS